MIKILYVNGGPMNRGGIEAFMLNYLRHFDRNRIIVDFAVRGPEIGEFDKYLVEMGCKIYRLPMRSRHPLQYQKQLKRILKENKYDAIHSHVDAMNYWVLSIAKRCGVPVRISHSHNTQHLTTNPIKYMINEYARLSVNRVATHRLACSEAAGRWLYGKNDYKVVHNAIEYSKYRFSYDDRKKIRTEYSISEDTILLGNVGRFDTQKNHVFLIRVLAELVKLNAKYKVMLVGDGWLRKEIEMEIMNNNLRDYVIFVGERDSAACFYSAFDIFVLPSLFEGLGFVLIEAQANGLVCISSDGVPKESNVTGVNNVRYLPLKIDEWVETILEMKVPERYISEQDIKARGYDIIEESQKLENYYISIINEVKSGNAK